MVIHQNKENLYKKFMEIPEKPDALICSNDMVPEDVAIAGFDDIEPAKMVTPSLTTVHVKRKLMGQNVTKRLLYRIANPKAPIEKVIMGVDIVERGSTAR